MSEARVHHPFGPSKLQAIEASPRYEGESGDSEASLRGTAQHDASERDEIDIDDPTLADNELEAVIKCREYRDAIVKTYAPGFHTSKEEYLPVDDVVLHIKGYDHTWIGTTAGYLDFAIISQDQTIADIFDWKFGLWSVAPAETNLQGIAYLLGLFHKFPMLQKITVHFVMPHRDEIDFHTFTRDEFPALYLRVRTVVARALAARAQTPPKCNPTVSSCLFCARKGFCLDLAAFTLKVGHKYAPVEVPANVTPSLISDAASSTQLMGIAQLMEAWSKAVRAQITAHAIENEDWLPEQYALRSRADTDILDYDAVRKAAKLAGVSDDQLKKAESLRMTDVHKAIMDAQPRGEKKAAVTAFTEGLIVAGAAQKENPIYFLQRLKT